MFRTRDFFLFSITVATLLLGIVVTANVNTQSDWLKNLSFVDNNTEYKAVVAESVEIDREQKLKEMRKKVAESDQTENLASLITSLAEEDQGTSTETGAEVEVGVINKCVNYISGSPIWSHTGLKFEVVEGARIVYRELTPEVATAEGIYDSNRDIVMQLPLRFVSAGIAKCLPSEVIGIAVDGSLIKNTDYTAYKVFGTETLIGYALDGFPIYGLNSEIRVDQCGGASVEGQYRYFLSDDREGMIGCFSSEPINL